MRTAPITGAGAAFSELHRLAEVWARAAERWVESARRMIAAFQTTTRAVDPRGFAIGRHGPRNVTCGGLWQSDVCAGWVHDACPAPRYCACTCHGGSLR